MEMLLPGMALQALALGLLAVVLLGGDAGRSILVRLRADGRTHQSVDRSADDHRRQVIRGLIGLFLGGTILAVLGLPRL